MNEHEHRPAINVERLRLTWERLRKATGAAIELLDETAGPEFYLNALVRTELVEARLGAAEMIFAAIAELERLKQ